jgi:hypothetical protein
MQKRTDSSFNWQFSVPGDLQPYEHPVPLLAHVAWVPLCPSFAGLAASTYCAVPLCETWW